MSSKNYDLVVIGAGPGGYIAAIRAAQLGFKTACIEKRATLGGTCLNVGCIPSKALLDSSEHYIYAKQKLASHGVLCSDVQLDLNKMMERKENVVKTLTQGIAGLFKKHKIDHISGAAQLKDVSGSEKKILVSLNTGATEEISASRVLLATGSIPIELPNLPFDGKFVISSTEALALKTLPKEMLIVGGGYIGLEMGSVWSRLGTKVTVAEFADRILPAMDKQIGSEIYKSLQKQGLVFKLKTKCLGTKIQNNAVVVELEDLALNQKSSLSVDVVLVCTGRKPYSEGLGLEACGIKKDPQGRVIVDKHFESSVKGVYAIGDLIEGPMLAHKAEEDGVAAVECMKGQAGHVNYDLVPGVIFTWPEYAYVGISEEQAKERGLNYKVGTFPFLANARAKAMGESEGLVKILADAKSDKVLGVHIFGPRASDLIPEAVSVMEFGGSAEDIARTCHAHPTLAEAVKEAALAVDKRTLNF